MCEHPQRVSFVPFPDVRTRVPGFWPISPWPSDTIKAKIEFQEVNQPRFSWFGFPLLCLLLGGCRIQVELHMNFKSLDHTYIHIQSHTYIYIYPWIILNHFVCLSYPVVRGFLPPWRVYDRVFANRTWKWKITIFNGQLVYGSMGLQTWDCLKIVIIRVDYCCLQTRHPPQKKMIRCLHFQRIIIIFFGDAPHFRCRFGTPSSARRVVDLWIFFRP